MAKVKLKGLHQVAKLNADGSTAWHIYAWRGGPKIAKKPQKLVSADAAILRAYQEAYERRLAPSPESPAKTLRDLISEWRASAEWWSLKPNSRVDYDYQLAKILDGKWTNPQSRKVLKIADIPLAALESQRTRGLILAWRDATFTDRLRTADKVIGTLSACINWGIDRGKVSANPLMGVKKLYSSNRSNLIWTQEDLDALKPHCSIEVWRAIRLTLLTGLAISDLVGLTWSAWKGNVLEGRRKKTGRDFLIPVTDDLKALLEEMPRGASTQILTHSHARAWTKSGLDTAFAKARDAAGFKGKLVFHDLRGTAATRFVAAGLSYAQTGAILGWDEEYVEAIARKYVDRGAVVAAILGKLNLAKGDA